MGRDKAKDDKLFNCSQEWELNYVAGLYIEKQIVLEFLKDNCKKGTIKDFTHMEVYKLIERKLGYAVPIEN
jgi:hypothetical protein